MNKPNQTKNHVDAEERLLITREQKGKGDLFYGNRY